MEFLVGREVTVCPRSCVPVPRQRAAPEGAGRGGILRVPVSGHQAGIKAGSSEGEAELCCIIII